MTIPESLIHEEDREFVLEKKPSTFAYVAKKTLIQANEIQRLKPRKSGLRRKTGGMVCVLPVEEN